MFPQQGKRAGKQLVQLIELVGNGLPGDFIVEPAQALHIKLSFPFNPLLLRIASPRPFSLFCLFQLSPGFPLLLQLQIFFPSFVVYHQGGLLRVQMALGQHSRFEHLAHVFSHPPDTPAGPGCQILDLHIHLFPDQLHITIRQPVASQHPAAVPQHPAKSQGQEEKQGGHVKGQRMRGNQPPDKKCEGKAGGHADSNGAEYRIEDAAHFPSPVQIICRPGTDRARFPLLLSYRSFFAGITGRPSLQRPLIPDGPRFPCLV